MSPAEKIALVGVVSTAAVGIAGAWLAKRSADSDRDHRERDAAESREHVERLARAERHHRARLDAYTEAARMLELSRLYVTRTFPLMTGVDPPQPPEPLGDDEWTALSARISIASSKHVLAAIGEAQTRIRGFTGAAYLVSAYQRQPPKEPGSTISARHELDAARERALAAIDDAQTVMREELETL